MKRGDRVVVINKDTKYYGKEGFISSIFDNRVHVEIESSDSEINKVIGYPKHYLKNSVLSKFELI